MSADASDSFLENEPMDLQDPATVARECERQRIREFYRGRPLGEGLYRNFCAMCGIPIRVAEPLRENDHLCCDDCAEHGHPREPEPPPPVDETDGWIEFNVQAIEDASAPRPGRQEPS